MNEEASTKHHEQTPCAFVLHFSRLVGIGPALSFPCDAAGRVDLDSLGELVSFFSEDLQQRVAGVTPVCEKRVVVLAKFDKSLPGRTVDGRVGQKAVARRCGLSMADSI